MRARWKDYSLKRASVLLYVVFVGGCLDSSLPVESNVVIEAHRYEDLCWPLVNGVCEARAATQNENNLMVTQLTLINQAAHPFCVELANQAIADMFAGKIQIWTVGPANYDPANYFGDRHNAAGVTHLTPLALSSAMDTQKTIIHESAHALGVSNDVDADNWAETCYGEV